MPSSLLRHCYELGEYVRETETRYVYRPKQSRSLGLIPKQMAQVAIGHGDRVRIERCGRREAAEAKGRPGAEPSARS